MRLNEIARELGKTSKEVVAKAQNSALTSKVMPQVFIMPVPNAL